MYNHQKTLKITLLVLIIFLVLIVVYSMTINMFKEKEEIINNPEIVSYTVSFDLNGADIIETKRLSCVMENGGCSIILPKAERNGGEVLGYNLKSDDINAKYLIGERINVNDNMKLYVISRKKNVVNIDNSSIDFIEENSIDCITYNDERKCKVKLPIFNKIGYENRGYSTSPSSLVGFIFPNEEYVISRDVTLYPIYGTNNHLREIEVDKTYTFLNSVIEIENGCTSDVYNEYLNYLNDISVNAPFLLLGNKISFISDNSFDKIWGSNYVGMNYGPRNLRAVDIRCGTKLINDYYGTMVHEMSHSWDFYYATKIGNNITSESDMVNLYNKYKSMSNKPFREYSYSNIYEFLADMMKYYYFKYVIPKGGYENLDYPDDIKRTLEKYICISENDYDKTKCS